MRRKNEGVHNEDGTHMVRLTRPLTERIDASLPKMRKRNPDVEFTFTMAVKALIEHGLTHIEDE